METRRPLFQEIKIRGHEIYKMSCSFCRLHEKLASTRDQLKFDLRCKRNDILPKSLRFQPPSGW